MTRFPTVEQVRDSMSRFAEEAASRGDIGFALQCKAMARRASDAIKKAEGHE